MKNRQSLWCLYSNENGDFRVAGSGKREDLANENPKYRHWKGLKGYQRYYAEQQIASKPGFQKGQMGIQKTVNQQQGRPGTGDQAKWDQWVTSQWSRMDDTDKQLYGNDMNKYSDIEKSRAKRHNTQ